MAKTLPGGEWINVSICTFRIAGYTSYDYSTEVLSIRNTETFDDIENRLWRNYSNFRWINIASDCFQKYKQTDLFLEAYIKEGSPEYVDTEIV